jgi:hypothetical protein
VAGRAVAARACTGALDAEFSGMNQRLPPPARLLGPAGLIPFAGLALACWLAPPGWRGQASFALLAYGATILAFLGAVHWGLALRATPAEEPDDWARRGRGVVPALVAWVALMLPAVPGLLLLAAALLVVAGVETLATRAGLMPPDYLRLRWILSTGAAVCLLAGASAQ